jgi:hypothetical protein
MLGNYKVEKGAILPLACNKIEDEVGYIASAYHCVSPKGA